MHSPTSVLSTAAASRDLVRDGLFAAIVPSRLGWLDHACGGPGCIEIPPGRLPVSKGSLLYRGRRQILLREGRDLRGPVTRVPP